ncbi:hypothetical protein D3C87_1800990 [compost metagenome]
MVANAEVFQFKVILTKNSHFFEGMHTIAPGGVVVQTAFQISVSNQQGKLIFFCQLDLV